MLSGLAGRAAGLVVTGFAGAVTLEAAKKVVRGGTARGAAVTVTSWGLRGVRAAEGGAEKARLGGADILSEARARIGEQSLPPEAGIVNGHGGHDH